MADLAQPRVKHLEDEEANVGNAKEDIIDQFESQARLGFIRKVYAILSMQLALTVGVCGLAMSSASFSQFILTNLWMFYFMVVLSFAVLIVLVCGREMAKKVPYNYILLGVFTFAEAYIVSVPCMFYDSTIVIMAALMTLGITIALTAYACLTKTDFTIMYGTAVNLLFCLMFLILFSFLIDGYVMEMLISVFGVFCYGMFLIIDTQMIASGHRHDISTEDYILGALMLYIDIIGMFIYILKLLGQGQNN